ncbi:MAG: hypothetical protein ABSF00_10850 [Candidatus Bathyarchaeia archaeon]|jgi:hypothetical protein
MRESVGTFSRRLWANVVPYTFNPRLLVAKLSRNSVVEFVCVMLARVVGAYRKYAPIKPRAVKQNVSIDRQRSTRYGTTINVRTGIKKTSIWMLQSQIRKLRKADVMLDVLAVLIFATFVIYKKSTTKLTLVAFGTILAVSIIFLVWSSTGISQHILSTVNFTLPYVR